MLQTCCCDEHKTQVAAVQQSAMVLVKVWLLLLATGQQYVRLPQGYLRSPKALSSVMYVLMGVHVAERGGKGLQQLLTHLTSVQTPAVLLLWPRHQQAVPVPNALRCASWHAPLPLQLSCRPCRPRMPHEPWRETPRQQPFWQRAPARMHVDGAE